MSGGDIPPCRPPRQGVVSMSSKASNQKAKAPMTKQNSAAQTKAGSKTPVLKASNVKSEMATTPLMSTSKSTDAKDFGDDWMNKHNFYLASLRDPVANAGARIPDGLSPLTVTVQCVTKQLLLTNAQGVCGAMMGYNGSANGDPAKLPGFIVPMIHDTTNGGTAAVDAIGWTCGDASSVGQMMGETSLTGHRQLTVTGITGFLEDYASSARLVSATMNLQPAVGFEKADGTYLGVSLPPNFFESAAMSAANMDYTKLQNTPGAVWAPVYNPKDPGITVTYTPTDTSCNLFADGSVSTDYYEPQYNSYQPAIMGVFCSQASGNQGANHMLQVCLNYEIVIQTASLAFGVGKTIMDPLSYATAINARRNDPLCFIGSEMFAISPSSTRHESSTPVARSAFSATSVTRKVSNNRSVSFSLQASPTGSQFKCSCTKGAREVEALEEDKPLFESLVDTLGGVVKKGLPKLFPMLGNL